MQQSQEGGPMFACELLGFELALQINMIGSCLSENAEFGAPCGSGTGA